MTQIVPQKIIDLYINRTLSSIKEVADKAGCSFAVAYKELSKLDIIRKRRDQPIVIPKHLLKDYIEGRITNITIIANKLGISTDKVRKRLKEMGIARTAKSALHVVWQIDPFRDKLILQMRGKGATLAMIGKRFNVSKERIRQIIANLQKEPPKSNLE